MDAAPGSIPWQVGLVGSFSTSGSSGTFCGGTIIDSYHIMTAAHCTEFESASSLAVMVGEHDVTAIGGK